MQENITSVPLPLKHGCLFIDNSFLEHLQVCPRLLEYSNLRQRIMAGEKAALNFGTCAHYLLDYRYRHYGVDLTPANRQQCEDGQSAIAQKFYNDFPLASDSTDHRNLNWAVEVFIKQYNNRYPLEPFSMLTTDAGKPMVEQAFALPFATYSSETGVVMPWVFNKEFKSPIEQIRFLVDYGFTPIFYMGRIDLPILWDSGLYIMDHKTTGAFGKWSELTAEYAVSPQQIGYCWAWEHITGTRPKGFVINMIKTWSLPQKDINKDNFAKWWEEKFYRHKEYVYQDTLDEWQSNTLALVEELLWWHRKQFFPQKKKWCVGKYGRCSMYDVCNKQQSLRLDLLFGAGFMDNVWSPLERPGAERVLEEVNDYSSKYRIRS